MAEKQGLGRTYGLPAVLIALSLAAYGGLLSEHIRFGTLRDGHVPETLVWYGLAFVAYLGMIVWGEKAGRVPARLIWLPAIAFRLLLLFTVPTLSDDVYRYLWDGYIANQGVSPFAFPIDSPELAQFDAPIRALANHAWMASPYLPAAQWPFALVTRVLSLQPLSMQAIMLVFDLLAAAVIVRLLRLAELPARRTLIYLWHPLVIVETAHGAHVDAYMILLMLLGIWAVMAGDSRLKAIILSPVLLAFATLTKILPGLLAPVLFWRWRWRGVLVYIITLIVVLFPAGLRAGWGLSGPLDGRGLFGALRIYGDQWNFNSGLFHWIEVGFRQMGEPQPDDRAKIVVGAMLLAVLMVVWLWSSPYRSARSIRASLRWMAVPFAAYLLLAPTLHPWYSLSLLAFLPFLSPGPTENRRRWLDLAPWLYLSAALMLSYITYINPDDFREYEWVRRLEWLPTLGLLAIVLVWRWRNRAT